VVVVVVLAVVVTVTVAVVVVIIEVIVLNRKLNTDYMQQPLLLHFLQNKLPQQVLHISPKSITVHYKRAMN
jgi:hypothetical protein